ncbi:MAG: hypothetical protein V7701_01100 [Sneathiella sp.]
MAASTDTIQILLRQRQELRQALLDLREEIETLDASSLDLVNKNVKSQKAAPVENNKPLEAVGTGQLEAPIGNADSPEQNNLDRASEVPQSEKITSDAQKVSTLSEPSKASDVRSLQPSERSEPQLTRVMNEPVDSNANIPPASPSTPVEKETMVRGKIPLPESDDPSRLLANAQSLSAFFLEHPSIAQPAQLAALDTAISGFQAAAPAKSLDAYHSLRNAYRTVASQSYANQNINGTTLIDSKNGARLLWIIPLCIAALVLVVFPFLLFSRTMANEMFIADFATNLVWVFGASSAFLWGTVGALTLLTVTIALQVRHREYDADIRYSSALQGALGGIIGCLCFLTLQIWVPTSNVAAEFGLNLAAFAVGMAAGIIFAALQRVITLVTGIIEPSKK